MKRWNTCIAVWIIVSAVLLALPAQYGHGEGEESLEAKESLGAEKGPEEKGGLFKIPEDATARTLDGETVSLAAYKGKMVFLNVWRIDCKPCLFEIPILNRLHKEYSSEDFAVIGLSVDRGGDQYIGRFVKAAQVEYPIWLGYGQPLTKYVDVGVTPFLWAVTPEGELLGYIAGAFPTYEHAVESMKRARKLMEAKDPEK